MLLALFSARLRALAMTIALAMAAPRVAGWLRNVGERQRRRGRPGLAWRAPVGVAYALERVAGKRQSRLSKIRNAGGRGLSKAGRGGRQAGERGIEAGQRGVQASRRGVRAGRRALTRH
jgi:hypothetical protein